MQTSLVNKRIPHGKKQFLWLEVAFNKCNNQILIWELLKVVRTMKTIAFTGATILPMTVLSPEDGDKEPASGIISMHIGNTHKFGGS